MINIIFCGYRSWANEIFDQISSHPKINILARFRSNEEFETNIKSIDSQTDIILFIGWSWILKPEITNRFLCVGIHPSDLPHFRGGSPLQHQIIQGLTDSKVSLMTLSNDKIDAGEIWLKEELSLLGDSMSEIFQHIVKSSVILINHFFDTYSTLKPEQQDVSKGTYFKRRKPEESRLTIDDLNKHSLQDIYNFMRSLTDPYPNAFLEDKNGNRLYFTGVRYESNLKNS